MKKVFLFGLIICFAATAAFAAFTPQQLKFSAPTYIHYNFDGSDLDINFDQTGTNATVIVSIFTKGKASNIVNINNGRIGWHYVNKIDTCVFVSTVNQYAPGSNTFTWDGTSSDGGDVVAADEYTYYIWGYDNVGFKTSVAKYIGYEWMDSNVIITKNEDGTPKTQPVIYDCPDRESYYTDKLPFVNRYTQWDIGTDPQDSSLIRSTYLTLACSMYEYAVDPDDNTIIYVADTNHVDQQWVSKYSWVPGGYADMDMNWGIDGKYTYTTDGGGQEHYFLPGVYDIGYGQLVMPQRNMLTGCLAYIDKETGDEIRTMDLERYYIWYHLQRDVWRNITPTLCDLVGEKMFILEPYTFKLTAVNPYATDVDDNFYLWHNGAGDGVHDHYSGHADWSYDTGIFQYAYRGGQDANGHTITSAYDLGATSFDLCLADGTGVGYFNFAGEVSGGKNGVQYVDYGSAYDGMYMDNSSNTGGTGDSTGWFYIASDSFTGTITPEVIVNSAAPAAYTVAQNTPNPFNPTTTISFNLAKAGKTTVDIYNVAGQKVDTLVNGSMSAGNHSVVWNAAKFSAGVYFYTVKSGSFSKTMKMTLVK